MQRKIIHIDMDAFFAAVEQRDNPQLVGKPVIVGGKPHGRGVVAAASYEARKFGVRSALPSTRAYKLCPQGIFVKPRFHVYRRVSRTIMGILREYTPLVEPMSVDEAYLDITNHIGKYRYASRVAKSIKQQIKQHTGLTASAGVAPNKFLAKIASDLDKPDGLSVIRPEEVESLLAAMDIRKIPGIGKVTEAKLVQKGIVKVKHLQERNLLELEQLFGKRASWYYNISRGIDTRTVKVKRIAKSVSVERTFSEDIFDRTIIEEKLVELSHQLVERAIKKTDSAKTITLKITYADFQKITRSKSYNKDPSDADAICHAAIELISSTEAGKRPIRLVGIGFSGINKNQADDEQQLNLGF